MYWAERSPDDTQPNRNILKLYQARYAALDGQPIGEAQLLQQLDQHPEAYAAPERDPNFLDSGSEVFVSRAGDSLAMVYNVNYTGLEPDDYQGGHLRCTPVV